MTRDDIVKTAFKVWGRDLYRTMSLTQISQELGVSKPALYRHFRDKDALLDAMYTAYFDDCAAFIRDSYHRAVSADKKEAGLIMMRIFSEYYIRNKDLFVFALIQVFSRRESKYRGDELRERGIDLQRLADEEGGSIRYPSNLLLFVTNLVFDISFFHRFGLKRGEIPSDDQVKKTVAQIENQALHGLGLDARKVAALNYQELEERAAKTEYGDTENNVLLRAVAGAVAEAGPWNASMEMVARLSGLSKSGLYAHFKNKKDMLGKLFVTEFTRIMDFARAQIETSEVPEEQLYLAIITIVNYLRARPEILVAMDWIKTRRLDIGRGSSGRLYRIIRGIKQKAIQEQDKHLLVRIGHWIIFMITNTLVWWPGDQKMDPSRPDHSGDLKKNVEEIPNESFRILFRFIALGLEGLNDE